MSEEEEKQEQPVDDTEGSEEENEQPEEEEQDPKEDDSQEEEEVLATFSDEEEEQKPEDETSVLKNLREVNRKQEKLLREKDKAIKELEGKSGVKKEQEIKDPGEEPPDLDDFVAKYDDYNEGAKAHKAAVKEWVSQREKYNAYKKDLEKRVDEERQKAQEIADKYTEQKKKLPFSEEQIIEAEEVVTSLMSNQHIGVIGEYVEDSAKFLIAVGLNPALAKKLGSIDVGTVSGAAKFGIEISKLEGKLKVTQRKPATTPERKVKGAGPPMGSHDKELERLEKEFEKRGDGDRSAIIEYKRKLRAQKE
jgi:hypothetical protein